MKFNEYEFNRLKYEIRADSIIFTCDAIDGMEKWKNTAAANVINDLLLDFSSSISYSDSKESNSMVTVLE